VMSLEPAIDPWSAFFSSCFVNIPIQHLETKFIFIKQSILTVFWLMHLYWISSMRNRKQNSSFDHTKICEFSTSFKNERPLLCCLFTWFIAFLLSRDFWNPGKVHFKPFCRNSIGKCLFTLVD
jgi:hypothetical protein